jgi:hypothetical protein
MASKLYFPAHPANDGVSVTEDPPARLRLSLTILLLAIVAGVVDLILDAPTDWRSFHVLYELGSSEPHLV